MPRNSRDAAVPPRPIRRERNPFGTAQRNVCPLFINKCISLAHLQRLAVFDDNEVRERHQFRKRKVQLCDRHIPGSRIAGAHRDNASPVCKGVGRVRHPGRIRDSL